VRNFLDWFDNWSTNTGMLLTFLALLICIEIWERVR